MKLTELFEDASNFPEFTGERLPDRSFAMIDSRSYDGAPDGADNKVGFGKTEQDALDDLCDKLAGVYPANVIEQARAEYLSILTRGEDELERRNGVQDERPRADFL